MAYTESDIENLFSGKGAKFVLSASDIKQKTGGIKAFIFDWDGVFNAGIKGNEQGSPFSETDSMGLNMLRFSFYLKFGYIPAIFIVTGEDNQPALKLSKREHFNGVYIKFPDKLKALNHIGERFGYKPGEIGFVFDDILDLSIAEVVSLRYFISREANPLLADFIKKNKLADYYTAQQGENNAVREISEMSIGLLGNYKEVLLHRIKFSEQYQKYLTSRNDQKTQYFTLENNRIADFIFT